MKIAIAQTRPVKGELSANLKQHIQLIQLAAANDADAIIFPELSLTGYEPTLARDLATHLNDSRLDELQTLSNTHQLTIGAGLPTQSDRGRCISLVLFQPHQARRTYSKKYLHPDEEAFFISGPNFPVLTINEIPVGLAICYELSIPEHAAAAYEHGAQLYVASVAKTLDGVNRASQRLAAIAREYAIPVLMANCVGPADNVESAGGSAVWNHEGQQLDQLNSTQEGLIVYDMSTGAITKQIVNLAETDGQDLLRVLVH
ncbi:MAG: carbon-nitrogen hydrolase family protein [Cyanobacteria bacterium P01_H01_bin.152]